MRDGTESEKNEDDPFGTDGGVPVSVHTGQPTADKGKVAQDQGGYGNKDDGLVSKRANSKPRAITVPRSLMKQAPRIPFPNRFY